MSELKREASTISLSSMCETHIDGLAKAHMICFPGYFLTNLGEDFLRTYYGSYLHSVHGFGVVALDDKGEVVAFAVGTTELDGQDAKLLRAHAGRVLWTVAKGCLLDAEVRRQVYSRLRRFGRVIKRASREGSSSSFQGTPAPFVSLTSIGVVPALRGSGLASELLNRFELEARTRDFREIRASTSIDNFRAVEFYKKSGWLVQSVVEEQNGITFQKPLD